jgi:hypothetical protein
MHKILYAISIFAFIGISHLTNAQNFVWAKQMGGTGIDQGNSIAMDESGNLYSTGSFKGTVDFDPGPATFNLTSAGIDNLYILKLDAAGNFVWAKQFTGALSTIQGFSIALDDSSNVYTTGYFTGTVDFDPNSATLNITGNSDLFVSKLNAEGNLIWAKKLGGANPEKGLSITVDRSGNVYTTGYFGGTADFDPGPGTFNLQSAGFFSGNAFISKLNAAGNFVWAKQMVGVDTQTGNSITTDATGNVYTTGFFTGTADFDPGAGTFNLISVGDYEIFISKLDSAGNFVWAKQMGGTSTDNPSSIALDASGNIYTAGKFFGTSDFDPGAGTFTMTSAGNFDVFISKLDTAGNFIWAKQMGSSGADVCNSIRLDASGNIHATGSFRSTPDFDPGPGVFNLTSKGGDDAFILKLDPQGNFVWATKLGGSSDDQGNSIVLDGSGNFYTLGAFKTTADFDPGAGTFNLSSAGNYDVFISKLNAAPTLLSNKIHDFDLRVYPNPTNDFLFIEVSDETNAMVEIFNTGGQLKQSATLESTRTTLPVNHLPEGIYFMKIRNSQGAEIKKFVKN